MRVPFRPDPASRTGPICGGTRQVNSAGIERNGEDLEDEREYDGQ